MGCCARQCDRRKQIWDSTAIFVQWDDWGGLDDPVPPPFADYDGLGFRVPMLVISPYAKRGYVSHKRYETASVLRFAENLWGLAQMSAADRRANSPAFDCFDFSQKPRKFVRISAPKGARILPPSRRRPPHPQRPIEKSAKRRGERVAPAPAFLAESRLVGLDPVGRSPTGRAVVAFDSGAEIAATARAVLPEVISCSSFLYFFFLSVQKFFAAFWLLAFPASPKTPAVSGEATLVPATVNQPPSRLSYSATNCATADTSESVRDVQPVSCCHDGLVMPGAQPLPASGQTVSE